MSRRLGVADNQHRPTLFDGDVEPHARMYADLLVGDLELSQIRAGVVTVF